MVPCYKHNDMCCHRKAAGNIWIGRQYNHMAKLATLSNIVQYNWEFDSLHITSWNFATNICHTLDNESNKPAIMALGLGFVCKTLVAIK